MVWIAVSGEVYPCTTHAVSKDFRLFPTYGRSLGHDDIVKYERQFGTMVGHGESTFKRGIPCKHIVVNRCAVLVGFQTCGFKSRGTQHCFDIEHICNRTFRICLFESIRNSFRMIAEPLLQFAVYLLLRPGIPVVVFVFTCLPQHFHCRPFCHGSTNHDGNILCL